MADRECNREWCVWLMGSDRELCMADGECNRECCVWLMGSATGSVVCG